LPCLPNPARSQLSCHVPAALPTNMNRPAALSRYRHRRRRGALSPHPQKHARAGGRACGLVHHGRTRSCAGRNGSSCARRPYGACRNEPGLPLFTLPNLPTDPPCACSLTKRIFSGGYAFTRPDDAGLWSRPARCDSCSGCPRHVACLLARFSSKTSHFPFSGAALFFSLAFYLYY